ncbi:alpha/beta hydrolase [Flaviaesturariibacter terrae]
MRLLLLLLAILFARPLFAADSLYTETPFVLHTPTGDLQGTLMRPLHKKGKLPVALIIAGSGPTDRDGNTIVLPGKNNSLLYLARGLAAQGIASLRYDKRGIAASKDAGAREEDLRFDQYIADAAAWIDTLRHSGLFGRITVIGHSEGTLIGMLAAPRADRFVSVAGAGFPADSILRRQLANLPEKLRAMAFTTLDSLKVGQLVRQPPVLLASLFRPSVQPYLISWISRDPRKAIADLRIPVLIVQGDKDLQVTVSDAEALHVAAPKAQYVLVKNMNHVLKLVDSDDSLLNQKSYTDPALPVAPQLLLAVSAFIRKP